MAAVFGVTTTRVRDGKYEEALGRYRKLKGVIERHGGTFSVRTQLFGANPLAITTIIEAKSWSAFGALFESLQSDADYQDFVAQVRANPFGDIVQRNVVTEVDL